MDEILKDAIKQLSKKASEAVPHEALHLSQAALNLAHTLQVLSQTKQ